MSEPILPIRRPHPKGRSFRRHRQRRRIAGVCAGLEDYTGWDRNLLRFLFLFSLLFGGLGLWIYLLLWIAVPSAKETPIPNISSTGRRLLKGLRREVLITQKMHEPWLGDLVNTAFDSIKLLMPEMEKQTTGTALLTQSAANVKAFDVLLKRINQIPAEDFRRLDREPLAQRLVHQLHETQRQFDEASLLMVDKAFLSSIAKGDEPPHPTFLDWKNRIKPLKTALKERGLIEVEPLLSRIEESLRFLFSRLEHYQSDLLDTRPHDIQKIAFVYLPDTLQEYLKLPESLARTAPIRMGGTAKSQLLDQLTLLDRTLHDFSRSLFSEDAKGLLIHGRFLKEKFNEEGSLHLHDGVKGGDS